MSKLLCLVLLAFAYVAACDDAVSTDAGSDIRSFDSGVDAPADVPLDAPMQ